MPITVVPTRLSHELPWTAGLLPRRAGVTRTTPWITQLTP